MARKQTEQITFNVTPEQKQAYEKAYIRAVSVLSTATKNEIWIGYLREFCEAFDIEWPDAELPPTEGRNSKGMDWKQGHGGKFVKKE